MNMDKLSPVISGSITQTSFTQESKSPIEKKINILVSDEDAILINNWLIERDKQRNLAATSVQDALSELLIPASGEHHNVITICRNEVASITLQSESYDGSLATVLKRLREFEWKKPFWKRELKDVFTPHDDQVIEIAASLLNAGYALKVKDESLKTRILLNDYQPSPPRIVSSIDQGFGKQFQIQFDRKDDEVKKAVSSIPNVKQFNNFAYVPYLEFEAVIEIADQFRFQLRPGAEELIAEAKANVR